MRHPQILVYESDGRLAAELRDLANKKYRWALREPRQQETCLRLVRRGGPIILLIKIGRDIEHELALLEQVHAIMPDTRIVAVSDTENARLADLAWDLGATFVLFPPQPRERLAEIVESLILSVPKRSQPIQPPADIALDENAP